MNNGRIQELKTLLITALVILLFIGCGGRPSLTNKSARQLFEIGKKEYENKKYLGAIESFQAVVYNHPGESVVDTAQYYLALSYFGNKEYEVAGVEFNRLALNYPSSVYFEQSIFMRAVCYYESTPKHYGLDQSELEKAIKQFEDFIIDFPESEVVPDAQKYLVIARTRLGKKFYSNAVVYRHIGAYVAAQKYYQIVVDDYTDTEYAPHAVFENAEINMKMKKYAEAHEGFENFLTVFPNHELVSDAKEKAREAAFKSGVSAYNKGELPLAKQQFEIFIKNYPNDDRVGKARDYLSLIGNSQSVLSQDHHAES